MEVHFVGQTGSFATSHKGLWMPLTLQHVFLAFTRASNESEYENSIWLKLEHLLCSYIAYWKSVA